MRTPLLARLGLLTLLAAVLGALQLALAGDGETRAGDARGPADTPSQDPLAPSEPPLLRIDFEPTAGTPRAGTTFTGPRAVLRDDRYRFESLDCEARLGGRRQPDGTWTGGTRLAGRAAVAELPDDGGGAATAAACAWDVPRGAAGASLAPARGGYVVRLAGPGGRDAEVHGPAVAWTVAPAG